MVVQRQEEEDNDVWAFGEFVGRSEDDCIMDVDTRDPQAQYAPEHYLPEDLHQETRENRENAWKMVSDRVGKA